MKNELREKYLIVRKNIIERDKLDEIIYNKVISNLQIINSSGVLIYVSLDDEVDTIRIINYLLSKKKLVAIPRVEGKTMNFYYINSLEDTHMGKFGILDNKIKVDDEYVDLNSYITANIEKEVNEFIDKVIDDLVDFAVRGKYTTITYYYEELFDRIIEEYINNNTISEDKLDGINEILKNYYVGVLFC